MSKSLTLVSVLRIAGATAVVACSGPDALVGVNGAAGASNGGSSAEGDITPVAANASTAAPVGTQCMPSDEYRSNFDGYQLAEVVIDDKNPSCASGICVVDHFQGRTSCPYGQTQDELNDPQCFLPDSNASVSVSVPAQLLARPAAENVVCSCRCAGPDAGPFWRVPGRHGVLPARQGFRFPRRSLVARLLLHPQRHRVRRRVDARARHV